MAERTGDETAERARLRAPGRLRSSARRILARLREDGARAAASRFRTSVAICTALLLGLLWTGAALHLMQDKSQTIYLAVMNVGNLSQVVDEHVTRLVYEIDTALRTARQEYQAGVASGGPGALPNLIEDTHPSGAPVQTEIVDAAGYQIPAAVAAIPKRQYWGDTDVFLQQRGATADRLVIGKPQPTASGSDERTGWQIPLSRR